MVSDFLIYLLHLLFAHPFAYLVIYIVFVFGSALIINKDAKIGKWKYFYIIGFVFLFFNFFAGHYLNANLIHWAGAKGTATITDSYLTSTQYNRHDVKGHHVLIRPANGKIIETSFRDDDFNVYPSRNAVTYPSEGIEFHVSYLKHFPGAFVIINDDDSPWGQEQRCNALKSAYDKAVKKYNFDRGNADYRRQCIKSIHDIIDHRCYVDSTDLRLYYGDINLVNHGLAFP